MIIPIKLTHATLAQATATVFYLFQFHEYDLRFKSVINADITCFPTISPFFPCFASVTDANVLEVLQFALRGFNS